MKTLSIIIPVYNEQRTIKQILDKVRTIKLPDLNKEIIVVSDGSDDNTDKILSLEKNIKFLKHTKNMGKGAAVRTGLRQATGDFVIIQDADLEYDPNDYNKLLQPILKKSTEVVYGTRLANYPLKFWGRNKTVLPVHLVANRFLTLLVNILFRSKLTDMETGYKVFTKEVLSKLELESDRFEFEPEITIKTIKLGYNILEVPIVTEPRGYDEGKKIGLRDGIEAIWTIFRYRFYD
ncbi:MAG: glycosyltransferase family 2 protein [Candidatus Daviesbacteria bacterium]|nr:glycosyltransferase family 2 protein [Candidatus Daviesbacteria bacterium]